jgi:hypothetical protein
MADTAADAAASASAAAASAAAAASGGASASNGVVSEIEMDEGSEGHTAAVQVPNH